ncbi:hypothetical protein ACFQL1_11245 [Halomicroarcula sp. GCM10025709]|uniref:hypothetical protein n=1 Tax=Haloarcula TaxID=2237 RepID=UPI0024C2DC19|nr:hypothetical protein [Halomicroarcula sp. YJ-61-S]
MDDHKLIKVPQPGGKLKQDKLETKIGIGENEGYTVVESISVKGTTKYLIMAKD